MIRHDEYACRIQVAGKENAKWVLDHLSKSFVFRTSEPIQEVEFSAYSIFWVANGSQLSQWKLESLLNAIPGARLVVEPVLVKEAE